jgi:hypothetical protein
MSLSDIRTALDTALATLDIRPVQEIDRMPNVTGSACAAIVELGPVTPASFGSTSMDATFRVIVLAGRASERAARQKLDALIDIGVANSLADALEGDLSNAVGFCTVSASSEYRSYPMGDPAIEYLGCEFTVVIGT